MATRYFKKQSPTNPVILLNGQHLKFPTVDYRTGYFSTDKDSLSAELVSHIEGGRFGLSEVTWAEFEAEFLKKKPERELKQIWREEISGNRYKPNPFLELHGAAAVIEPKPNVPTRMRDPEATIAPEVPAGVKPEETPFVPTLGRR